MFCLKRQLERAMSAAPLASSMYLSKDSGVDGENHWFMFLLRFYLSPTSKHHMSQGMSVQHLLPRRQTVLCQKSGNGLLISRALFCYWSIWDHDVCYRSSDTAVRKFSAQVSKCTGLSRNSYADAVF